MIVVVVVVIVVLFLLLDGSDDGCDGIHGIVRIKLNDDDDSPRG